MRESVNLMDVRSLLNTIVLNWLLLFIEILQLLEESTMLKHDIFFTSSCCNWNFLLMIMISVDFGNNAQLSDWLPKIRKSNPKALNIYFSRCFRSSTSLEVSYVVIKEFEVHVYFLPLSCTNNRTCKFRLKSPGVSIGNEIKMPVDIHSICGLFVMPGAYALTLCMFCISMR